MVKNNQLRRGRKMSRHLTAYELYLEELSDVPMLSAEESEALIVKAKKRSQEAITQIIVSYQPLLRNFAKKMKWQDREEVMDFIQEGNMALLSIIQKFDLKKGVPFSSYAKRMVKYYIFEAYKRNYNLIRTPNYGSSDERKKNGYVSLVANFDDELSYGADCSEESSSSENLSDASKPIFQKLRDPETIYLNKERRQMIQTKLASLKPKERNILSLRYGFNNHREHTLEEIANLYGVTKSAIHQSINKYLSKCLDLENYFPNHKY